MAESEQVEVTEPTPRFVRVKGWLVVVVDRTRAVSAELWAIVAVGVALAGLIVLVWRALDGAVRERGG